MSHQDRLGNNGPQATGLTKPDDGDDRMRNKRENVAHAQDGIKLKSSRIPSACGIRLPHARGQEAIEHEAQRTAGADTQMNAWLRIAFSDLWTLAR